ncbi:MAG: efflux RND transporter periplasmic adaptor subunit [Planctomycetes bacterium]|nr:efflux RND transporter periplasmic adaptor subunit [Planctomycetota bacterium]
MDLNRLKIDRSSSRPAAGGVRRWRAARFASRAALLLALGLAAWAFRRPLMELADRLRLPEVETARVVRPDPASAGAVAGTAANGYIVAKVRAALSADTAGRIVELNVEEGQAVKKGFVVARLFSEEYEAALRVAEADLSAAEAALERFRAEADAAGADLERLGSARASAAADLDAERADLKLADLNHERIRQLVEDGVESPRALDEAEAARDSARARLKAAEAHLAAADASLTQGAARLEVARAAAREAEAGVRVRGASCEQAQATFDKTFIRAPFDGVVVLKDAEVGEVVSPNSQAGSSARGSVATMVDFSSLEVQAEVPETSLAAVQVGGTAKIFLDAHPDSPYAGVVERIWPTANRQKATVEVRVSFAERDERLRPEMGVRVVFLGDAAVAAKAEEGAPAEDMLLIPSDALARREGGTGVFVLEGDIVRYRGVALGARRSNRVAVEEGLAEEEIVVRSPPPSLGDGDRVRVKKSP